MLEESRAINIVVSDKTEQVSVTTNPYGGRRFSLNALVISINGQEFNGIDIHHAVHDDRLKESLKECDQGTPISFTINRNGGSTTYTCSDVFSQRFKRCLFEGLCNFTKVSVTPHYPSCVDLVEYLNTGITNFPSQNINRDTDLLTATDELAFSRNVTALRIFGTTGRVHYCTHIGEGVYFSIIGHSKLYFHTIEEIINTYGYYLGMPPKYYKVCYKNDESLPAAGADSIM